MIIFSQHYPGLHMVCTNCGCLFGYSSQEIYENKYVYCPSCREKLETNVREDGQLVEASNGTQT